MGKEGTLQYPEDWIEERYVTAADPKDMIRILAELNGCRRYVIEDVLRRRGVLQGRSAAGIRSNLYLDEISGEIMDTAGASDACGITRNHFQILMRDRHVVERNGHRFVLHTESKWGKKRK